MGPKILLVDDREDNLLSIEAILESGGYECVKANSGRQALRILLTEFDFALILMDVKMPSLNGFETATLIYERRRLQHIPIIFVTANNANENIFEAYQSGAVDYLFKPINPDILRAKVGVLVDLYKKTRLLAAQEQKLIAINKSLEREVADRKISEEKVHQLNRQLLENIAILESSNKDLGRFTFMASYDLQEPLGKIKSLSNQLNAKYKEGLQEDAMIMSRISDAADRMQTLIANTLDLSKITSEDTALEECNLNTLLEKLIGDMDEEIREHKAAIQVESIPPLFVISRLMRPLFQNLINNALKFKKANVDAMIKIRSEISSAIGENGDKSLDNKYCRIFVEDNGIGFDQKHSEEIFGMSTKLHRADQYPGNGIGLALCKRITDLHKGQISARSSVGEGSTFIVSLPLRQEKSA